MEQFLNTAMPASPHQVGDHLHGFADLVTHGRIRHIHARLQHAGRQPRERLHRRTRVDGAQRPRVSGVERLEEVVGFPAAHLPDEDPIRSVAQRGAEQVAHGHRVQVTLCASFLESHHIRHGDLQFGGLFYDHHALVP
ncbi:MAG: hypothetical protein U0Q11_20685, partial [Vicinamibacterales bacterium]